MSAARRPLVIIALTVLVIAGCAAGIAWWFQAQRSLGAEVARLAAVGDIRMLASEDCAICHVARTWFNEHRIAFSECMVERDAGCRAEYQALQAAGTPVLVVRGRALHGFEPHRLRQMLRAPA